MVVSEGFVGFLSDDNAYTRKRVNLFFFKL